MIMFQRLLKWLTTYAAIRREITIFIKKRYWILLLVLLQGISAWMLCFRQEAQGLAVDSSGNLYIKSDIAMSWGNMLKRMKPDGKQSWFKLGDYGLYKARNGELLLTSRRGKDEIDIIQYDERGKAILRRRLRLRQEESLDEIAYANNQLMLLTSNGNRRDNKTSMPNGDGTIKHAMDDWRHRNYILREFNNDNKLTFVWNVGSLALDDDSNRHIHVYQSMLNHEKNLRIICAEQKKDPANNYFSVITFNTQGEESKRKKIYAPENCVKIMDVIAWQNNYYLVAQTKSTTRRAKDLTTYHLIKMSSRGELLWRYRLRAKHLESVGGLTIDGEGNILTALNTRWGYSILKINKAGFLLWRRNINPKKSMVWGTVFALLFLIRNGIKLRIVGYKQIIQRLAGLSTKIWRREADAND